jgi:hemolysin type calcium-binding protein
MRLFAMLVLLLGAAPAAHAATISGAPADGRLDVHFRAAPGERNELRVLPREVEVRFVGSGPLVAGDHCRAVNENEVRCGPPGPSGLAVYTRTGDGDDLVFAPIGGVVLGEVALGNGDDIARGSGLMTGGRGKDDLRSIRSGARYRGGARFHGGPGEDVLIGGPRKDLLDGGPGPDLAVGGRRFDEIQGGRGNDQLAGGFGRDVFFAGPGNDVIRATDRWPDLIRCGPGRDVAYVARRDRTTGCERIVPGWPS